MKFTRKSHNSKRPVTERGRLTQQLPDDQIKFDRILEPRDQKGKPKNNVTHLTALSKETEAGRMSKDMDPLQNMKFQSSILS